MGHDKIVDAESTAESSEAWTVWRRAQRAFKLCDYSVAVSELQHLIENYEAQSFPIPVSEAHFVLGVTLLRLRRTDEGIEQLLKSLEINPNFAPAHYKLGLGYGRLRQQDKALQQFRRALQLDPNNPEYLCRLGLQFRRLGLIEEAHAAYKTAREIKPDCEEADLALAELSGAMRPRTEYSYPDETAGYDVSHQTG